MVEENNDFDKNSVEEYNSLKKNEDHRKGLIARQKEIKLEMEKYRREYLENKK
ncbi:hypothetical protein Mgra_00008111, partial [Meloidogyne graminicola]